MVQSPCRLLPAEAAFDLFLDVILSAETSAGMRSLNDVVDLVVTDPQGRRLGSDAGVLIDDFDPELATYRKAGSRIQRFRIEPSEVLPGEYVLYGALMGAVEGGVTAQMVARVAGLEGPHRVTSEISATAQIAGTSPMELARFSLLAVPEPSGGVLLLLLMMMMMMFGTSFLDCWRKRRM